MIKTTPQKAQGVLLEHLDLLARLDHSMPVLDLACGEGPNGLVLAKMGIPVVFADRSAIALECVKQRLELADLPGQIWQVDLEQPGSKPLTGLHFSAILGFRYLYRPLLPALLNAVIPGGLIIYETFTTGNLRFGRPSNPDFLLNPGELKSIFRHWEILHAYEGLCHNPERVTARIVARKPRQQPQ